MDLSVSDAASEDAANDASATDAAEDAEPGDAMVGDAGWMFPSDSCAAAFYASGTDHAHPVPAATLASILAACPTLRARIAWQTGSGERVQYDSFTETQVARMEQLYTALVRGDADLGIACPDPATSTYFVGGTRPRATYLTAAQAFDVFAAHVAHAFYLEASRSVDWSLTQLNAAELDELLSSDRYFATIPMLPPDAYAMGYGSWNGIVTAGVDYQLAPRTFATPSLVCDPRDGYRFISGRNSTDSEALLADTARATLESLTLWLSENVIHGDCSTVDCTVPEFKFFLRDRLRVSARYGRITAPLGCHSAQNLMYDLARSVNIPLRAGSMRQTLNDYGYFFYLTHGALVFDFAREHPRVLQHVDDAYAMDITPAMLPREGAGAMTRAEIAHQLFEGLWSTVETLEAFNFEVPDGFPTVVPGDRYASMPGLYEDYSDFGPIITVSMPLAGHEPLDGTAGTVGAWYPAATGQYRLYEDMQVCGNRLVSDYCWFGEGGEAGFTAQMHSQYPGTTYSDAYGIDVNTAALWDRAAECVAALGGCAAAATLRTTIESTYGSNAWIDTL